MEFKDQLNQYMNTLNCSAKTLAEVSTLSPTVLSRYRNGERVPSAGSEQLKKLCYGISVIAEQNGHPEFSEEAVTGSFLEILSSKKPDPMILGSKLNQLISTLEINRAELSRFLNYDPSYLSRICSGQRTPANTGQFTLEVCRFVIRRYGRESDRSAIAELLGVPRSECSDDEATLRQLLSWFDSKTEAG
ncbi:MAG: helix-turn-helix transcriptional regulator [Blautia sp.]|nr:helix-turn-helix transcriptional regulator [Blautia sp.]